MKNDRSRASLLQKMLVGGGRLFFFLFVPVSGFYLFIEIYQLLGKADAPQAIMAVVAVAWGVGGLAGLHCVSYWLISKLSGAWRKLMLPYLFVGPALVILAWNTIFLVMIMVWMWTGYATVVYSAALKGVPSTLIEAARMDGAREIRLIFSIVIPFIRWTIVTVSTTILIITLKIFDIVYTMTGGFFGTDVVASMQYKQMFVQHDFGTGSAIAVLLFVAVIPVMVINLRQLGRQEGFK
jgi:ABC-type sugar transport system permease subunit